MLDPIIESPVFELVKPRPSKRVGPKSTSISESEAKAYAHARKGTLNPKRNYKGNPYGCN